MPLRHHHLAAGRRRASSSWLVSVPVGAASSSSTSDGRLPAGQDRTEPGPRAGHCSFLIPIIDRPVKVDMREKFIEVPRQTTITKDNAPINIDFLIYWYIVDPLQAAS